ncbi:hypothetical protein FACS1894152_0130 [Bacilli bacterium]|nr:hypothetical protein FACS1894152_0130 [Bacilli bacterium]
MNAGSWLTRDTNGGSGRSGTVLCGVEEYVEFEDNGGTDAVPTPDKVPKTLF